MTHETKLILRVPMQHHMFWSSVSIWCPGRIYLFSLNLKLKEEKFYFIFCFWWFGFFLKIHRLTFLTLAWLLLCTDIVHLSYYNLQCYHKNTVKYSDIILNLNCWLLFYHCFLKLHCLGLLENILLIYSRIVCCVSWKGGMKINTVV